MTAAIPTLTLGGKNFLFVAEEPVYLASLEKKLERMGLSISRATSAKEGFLKASQEEFDLIIAQFNLPDLSGLDFIDLLKAQNKTKETLSLLAGPEELRKKQDQSQGKHDGWLIDTKPADDIISWLEHLFQDRVLVSSGVGKVLAVDDSPIALKKFEQTLSELGYDFKGVIDPLKALDAIAEFNPDLVLMDQNMPDINGFDLTRKIRSTKGFENSKVVMVTSDQKKETVIRALDAGVVDFLTKPFDDEILLARMRTHISNKKLFDNLASAYRQMEKLNRKLEILSTTDGLTGLYNHRQFIELLTLELSKAKSGGAELSLLILDIDNFKDINDNHGHLAGDEALKHLGSLLAEQAKGKGMAARYGGDEFALILPGMGSAKVMECGEEFRQAVEKAEINIGAKKIKTTVSIGAVSWKEGDSMDAMMAAADKALYSSKAAGRNKISAG